jgi:hypothetical protein
MILHKIKGHHTSGLLFLFWLLLTFFGIFELLYGVRFYGYVDTVVNDMNINFISFWHYVVFFICKALMLILNCFADKPPNHTDYPKSSKPCPELTASFTNKIHFFWFSKICYLGFFRPLTEKDLFDIRPQDECVENHPSFDKEFKKSVEKNMK